MAVGCWKHREGSEKDRQTERRLCYSFECFVQATNHTRKTRTEHDEEKTAVPDWVVVRAGSC